MFCTSLTLLTVPTLVERTSRRRSVSFLTSLPSKILLTCKMFLTSWLSHFITYCFLFFLIRIIIPMKWWLPVQLQTLQSAVFDALKLNSEWSRRWRHPAVIFYPFFLQNNILLLKRLLWTASNRSLVTMSFRAIKHRCWSNLNNLSLIIALCTLALTFDFPLMKCSLFCNWN